MIVVFVSCTSSNNDTEGSDGKEKIDYVYHPPVGDSKDVAVIFLGGSEGGIPQYDYDLYTTNGYPAIALGYIMTDNTPKSLNMIPLEYFEKAIDYIKSRPEIEGKKIVLMGSSKGAEVSLLIAATYTDIDGVIVEAPSSVVFQGFSGSSTSSWSVKGESIPCVKYVPYDYSTITGYVYIEMFKLCLEQKDQVEKASIPVENINGPILLLSGTDDTMWPSADMGEAIINRLEENNFEYYYKHIIYDDAGHDLTEFNIMGGTYEGNKKARLDSDKRILEFLEAVNNS